MNTETLEMSDFLTQFGPSLLAAVNEHNPPVYQGEFNVHRDGRLNQLHRQPFDRQREAIHAISQLLIDRGEPAAVLNGEMGTGKTMMAIAIAKLLHDQGIRRALVICPPHLVYKWRREILETVPEATVMVLNGPDSLAKLIQLRAALGKTRVNHPEFFVMGRVRMRMGFHWKTAISPRQLEPGITLASCPDCGAIQRDEDNQVYGFHKYQVLFKDKRRQCDQCKTPLWSLMHRKKLAMSKTKLVEKAMCQIPTIGPKTAQKLIHAFGVDFIENMLADNIYEFINLMDSDGELIFSDKQATRMERSMANIEFGLGQGNYQPSEFIKRYLPNQFFGSLLVDEGHEYKNQGTAQGQAMGVLANKATKTLLLTGTLMGGYADDLFYLLWRIHRRAMIEDGYVYNDNNSLGTAAMAFMREHGILKDVYKESTSDDHRTAKGKKYNVTTSKAPGFGPKGITRYVLPYTVFVRLSEMGKGVLPDYDEFYENITLNEAQHERYQSLEADMRSQLNEALRKGDRSLLGLVINLLLRWPETCFNGEVVKHPHSRDTLAVLPSVIDESTPLPKEQAMIERCLAEKAQGRKTLVYTVYSGTRDTTARLKNLLDKAGLKTAALKASVSTDKREDWILDQVDRGIDVLITNPELVKTGLDLYDFPTLIFLQTGYNVYTLQQAARRSWRIGQTLPVKVYFYGYEHTAQIECLSLMAKKIAVSNSTSGVMPETGLDVLNQDAESIEVQLAKRILNETEQSTATKSIAA